MRLSAGSLRADVEETIDVYCRQCSVAVTARMQQPTLLDYL